MKKRVLLRTLCLLPTFLFSSTYLQAKDEPKLPKEWSEISPGGETACSRGTPFSFFYSPGTTNKVVIDFMGGGACWDAETCDHETKTFYESIEEIKKEHQYGMHGIYDRGLNENPLKEWTHVLVPYCTGDLHWGSADVTYTRADGTSFPLKHRGADNAKAVIDWVKTQFPSPETVFVTGTSAGAYASIFWLPYVKDHFTQSTVRQLGDSGISPITETFAHHAFNLWNIRKLGPVWIPSLANVDWAKLQVADLYNKLADHYPDVQFAHHTSAYDAVARYFYERMGGDPGPWPQIIAGNLQSLAKHSSRFHYFVSPGSEHCVYQYEKFYKMKGTDGTLFNSWLQDYVSGRPVSNLDCVNCVDDSL